jgi:opacity protein-like surface antigen
MYSRETDADWGTSFTGGGTAGVDYRVSDRLFLSAGLGVTSQIEDSAQVVPALGLLWRAADDWTVRVGAVPVSGGSFAGGEVEYAFNEALALGLGAQWNQRRFRLDDEGVAPDGVGEDQSIPLRLRLGWNVLPNVSLHFLAGVAVRGELELADRDGTVLREEDYDPAPYFGLRVFGRF